MRDRKLAARYARALLAALGDPSQAEAADAFLTSVAEALKTSVEFRNLMLNPSVSRQQRKAALAAVVSGIYPVANPRQRAYRVLPPRL